MKTRMSVIAVTNGPEVFGDDWTTAAIIMELPRWRLFLYSNHSHRNGPPLSLRQFQARRLRLLFRLERLRLRSELTIDVLEEKPLLDNFHGNFIAQPATAWWCSSTS